MARDELALRGARRSYTQEFKRSVIAQCQRGQSVSGVALQHGMNANIVHKWLRLSEADKFDLKAPAFVALPVPAKPSPPITVRVEITRGDTRVVVDWPMSGAAGCAAWLGEWLR